MRSAEVVAVEEARRMVVVDKVLAEAGKVLAEVDVLLAEVRRVLEVGGNCRRSRAASSYPGVEAAARRLAEGIPLAAAMVRGLYEVQRSQGCS